MSQYTIINLVNLQHIHQVGINSSNLITGRNQVPFRKVQLFHLAQELLHQQEHKYPECYPWNNPTLRIFSA